MGIHQPIKNIFHAFVVEDDRFFQQVLRDSLSQVMPGSRIDICGTVSEALRFCRQAGIAPNIALVDLGLPDASGIQVIKELVQRYPQSPVMVVSVADEEEKVLEAIRAGATGYVLKGDMTLSVTRAIEQLLKGIHPISATLAGYFLKLAGSHRPSIDSTTRRLTLRELDLLRQFASGKSYLEASQEMGVSLTTVQTHTRNLYRKLGVRSSLQALSRAKDHGLL